MEHRGQMLNADQLLEALAVLVEIQNKEIGTIFFDLSGHVNRTNIRIHCPVWIADVHADYRFELYHDKDEDDDNYYRSRNETQISQLKEILSAGKLPSDNEQEIIRVKEKEVRKQQYEELKKEFEPELV